MGKFKLGGKVLIWSISPKYGPIFGNGEIGTISMLPENKLNQVYGVTTRNRISPFGWYTLDELIPIPKKATKVQIQALRDLYAKA